MLATNKSALRCIADQEDVYMSERFAKKWETPKQGDTYINTLKKTMSPPPPLKPRLDIATRKLDLQIRNSTKLTNASPRKTKHSSPNSSMPIHNMTKLTQTCMPLNYAEIRKMSKLIMNARLALDQVSLRIKTVSELGDVVATLGPCVGVLRSISAD